jgi:hypothetical protein
MLVILLMNQNLMKLGCELFQTNASTLAEIQVVRKAVVFEFFGPM